MAIPKPLITEECRAPSVNWQGDMPQILDPRPIYYVYILFDWCGIPRYVGKGKGKRWFHHETNTDPRNQLKNEFIELTWIMLGEVPKIKVRENINEEDAFITESTLIKAIGRFPNGPLVNLTETRGPSSERIKQWHASRSPEERSATARKSKASMDPQLLSKIGRNNALAQGRDAIVERVRIWQASLTPQYRKEHGRKMGLASAAAATYEELVIRGLKGIKSYMENTTPEQRKENYKKTGVSKLTFEELSANGKKGVAIANAKRTPEERSELARKAALAGAAKKTPEERSELARRAGIKGGAAIAAKSLEERLEFGKRIAAIRKANGTYNTPTKGSVWINNGTKRRRIKPEDPLPEGWKYGNTLHSGD